MIITDYYKFARLEGNNTKTRIDCVFSTSSYEPFERLRNKQGELFIYFGNTPDTFKGNIQRKTTKALTKGKNISSIFQPQLNSNFAFGDMKGTTDSLLIIFSVDYREANNMPPSEIEIFVARGQNNNVREIFTQFSEGEFTTEINNMREQATE